MSKTGQENNDSVNQNGPPNQKKKNNHLNQPLESLGICQFVHSLRRPNREKIKTTTAKSDKIRANHN
jgi:hypothetical protein